jgi:hypothetical protein
MELYYTTCRMCGLKGEISGTWIKGNFSGDIISGLNPENCSGCWDLMQQNGAISWKLSSDGELVSVSRPTGEDQTNAHPA